MTPMGANGHNVTLELNYMQLYFSLMARSTKHGSSISSFVRKKSIFAMLLRFSTGLKTCQASLKVRIKMICLTEN